jgi:soluble lytic murein transglycosylase-like protein
MFKSIIFALIFVSNLIVPGMPSLAAAEPGQSDSDLATIRRADQAGRGADGQVGQLTVSEHLHRADVYHTNRAFAEARQHWQAILDRYPNDPAVATALFGMGRSYFQEKSYTMALPFYVRVAKAYPNQLEGREGLYGEASTLLRLGRAEESARRYEAYVNQYPNGEKIEQSYLNVIDTWREAGRPADAIRWIDLTRQHFPRSVTGLNALFARLRLDLAGHDWGHAVQTADELRGLSFPTGAMTNFSEVSYLRAYALEQAGRKNDAINAYFSVPDTGSSYSGAMATQRLLALVDGDRRAAAWARANEAREAIMRNAASYPAPFRDEILKSARPRQVDPRLVLAIMRQESSFRPNSKSPAAARGLLQLTPDTAHKYTEQVGIKNLQDDQLYHPGVSILIGSEYIAELFELFPHLPDAVVASYNGGEDNAARWLKRSKQNDASLFAAEVGFSETKEYVFKVMTNYRAYQVLYTEDLRRTF